MRLIVGVDGREKAMHALEQVVSRAKTTGDEVTVAIYSTDDSPPAVETAVRDRLDELEFDARIERLGGDPGSRLVEIAEQEEYDRIVLPGGRESPLGKIQLSSVIEFVLLNAHTTVTLIR